MFLLAIVTNYVTTIVLFLALLKGNHLTFLLLCFYDFVDTFGIPEFSGKPIAVASVSSGDLGGIRAAMSLQQLILAIQAYPQPQMLIVEFVEDQLNPEGQVINPSFEDKMSSFIKAFLGFANRF